MCFGGNRMGMFTILTKPLDKKDIFITRVKRPLENAIIKRYLKKVEKERKIKMYFNDVHIMYYVLTAIVGGLIGQFVDYCNRCFLKEQKIFLKESFAKYKRIVLPNYWLIFGIAITYIALLYKFRI